MKALSMAIAFALVAGTGFIAGQARAEADPKLLQERQALMKEQSADMAAVKGYLDGKEELAKAQKAAADLPGTMKRIPAVFPEGSGGKSPEGKYTTKPEIWTDWKGFLEIRDTAEKKSQALADAAKAGNKEAIQAAFADLGKNGCGACHGKFREEVKQ
jgi:cytochrome c556